MKFLLLLFLLINSCAKDKVSQYKKISLSDAFLTNTNSTPISFNSNDIFILDRYSSEIIQTLPQSVISTNPTFLNSNSNYILSYGLTPELFLIENVGDIQHYGYNIEFVNPKDFNAIPDGTISNDTYYMWASEGHAYIGLYYDPKNSLYYCATHLKQVTNISTSFLPMNTNIQEPFYITYYHSSPKTNIIYIADISTNQRLFYKPDNNTYFVKELTLVPTPEPLYPFLKSEYTIATSNQNNKIYNINIQAPFISNIFYQE